jgi:hypothetical protein
VQEISSLKAQRAVFSHCYLVSLAGFTCTYGWLSGSPYLFATGEPSFVAQRINMRNPTPGTKIKSQDHPDLPTSCILRVHAEIKGITTDKVSMKYMKLRIVNKDPSAVSDKSSGHANKNAAAKHHQYSARDARPLNTKYFL